jgi:hypothetical protein
LFYRTDDSNDLDLARIAVGILKQYPLPYGRPVGKMIFRQNCADDRDGWMLGVVRFGKITTVDQWDTHAPKVVRCDDAVISQRRVFWLRGRSVRPGERNERDAFWSKRQDGDERVTFNSIDCRCARMQLVIEVYDRAHIGIPGLWQRKPDRLHPGGIEARLLAAQPHKAS